MPTTPTITGTVLPVAALPPAAPPAGVDTQDPLPLLTDTRRQQLDGIVQQMMANKESDEYISGVVKDFKTKYSPGPAPAAPPASAPPDDPLTRFSANANAKLGEMLNPFPALKQILSTAPKQDAAEIDSKLQAGDYFGAVGSILKRAAVDATPGGRVLPDIIAGQAHQFVQAYKDLQDTKQMPGLGDRISSAAGHVLAGAIPILGPAAANAAEQGGQQIGSGDVAGGLGTIAGFAEGALAPKVGEMALPAAAEAVSKVKIPEAVKIAPQLDPAEASAVAYGHANDVQMPTSVQTGSKVAANAENIAQHLPFSSSIAKAARAKEQSTLGAAGANEVDQLGAQPGTNAPVPAPLDAGEAIHGQLDQNIAEHHAAAGTAYDQLRSIESQPQYKATVQTGTKRVEAGVDENGNPAYKSVPVHEDIQLPVPLRPVKLALKPIYDRMMRQMPVAQQQASAGLKALSNIVNGPDFESASITDENLGAIKQIARETTSPVGQGLAKLAVKELDRAVRATVARAGPDATAALEQGRASTIAKYGAQDLKDSLPAGGVDLANKLTAPGDRSIALLRSVAAETPAHIPALAQSVVQGLLEKVTADAGMGKPQTALTAWSKLGAETKSILFKGREQGLTDFFTLAKKMGENPNPSGTGSVVALGKAGLMLVTQPHIGIPMLLGARALTRVLFEPTGARNLIAGMKLPLKSGAIGAQVATDILKAAGPEAVPATPQGVSTSAANSATIGNNGGSTAEGQSGALPGSPRPSAPTSAAAAGGGGSSHTAVSVAGQAGDGYRAEYKLRELNDLQASHNGNSFAPNAKYAAKNDRDYTNVVNQRKVVDWSSRAEFRPSEHVNTNPDATSGPMVTDSQGQVLGGNGRKMILDRVYSGNPDGAAGYRALLKSKAGQFGIDPAAVDGMKQPVLVREIGDTELARPNAKQTAITDFNKKGTADLTGPERAIADSRRVSTATLDDVASRLDAKGPKATLADALEGKAGGEVLQQLIDDGVVSPQEQASLVTKDGLTKAGRDRVSQLMIGRYFSDPAQMDRLSLPIRGKIERVAAPLAQVEAKGAWNLTPDVQAAVDIVDQAQTLKIGSVADFIKQDGLFGKDKYSPQAITLAKAMKVTKSAELTAAARQYAQDAAYADKGQSLMGDAPTPKESFAASFGALKSGAETDAAALKVKVGGAARKAAAKAEASVAPVASTAEEAKPLGDLGGKAPAKPAAALSAPGGGKKAVASDVDSEPIAIRKLEAREYGLHPGDALRPSEIWENHEPTGKFLSGTSAFDMRDSLDAALKAAQKWKVIRDGQRPRIAFLTGDPLHEGVGSRVVEDMEIVVQNAKAHSIYEFHSGRWHHVAGAKPLGDVY